MSMSKNKGEKRGDFLAGFISGLCVFGIAALIFLIFLWII